MSLRPSSEALKREHALADRSGIALYTEDYGIRVVAATAERLHITPWNGESTTP